MSSATVLYVLERFIDQNTYKRGFRLNAKFWPRVFGTARFIEILNMSEFKNKWALILGGSSGLGLASAKKLASEGMNICIVHRDRKSNLEAFGKEIDAMKSYGVSVKTFNKDALDKNVRNEILNELPTQSVTILLHSIAKGSLKKMYGAENEILSKQDFDITIHAMAISWYEWTQTLILKKVFLIKLEI